MNLTNEDFLVLTIVGTCAVLFVFGFMTGGQR